MESRRDIFISYKNDGEGIHFAGRLADKLKNIGYEVYYNQYEQHAGDFPEELREAVKNCKDFILIVTQPCLDQLIKHEKIDWVRDELLTAHRSGKNIIPLLMPGVSMPKDKDDMPDDLRFLPDKNAITFPEKLYDKSPFDILMEWMNSKPEKNDQYRNSFNNNQEYDVTQDFNDTLALAQSGDVKAMYEIGIMYYFGFSSPDGNNSSSNYREAARWFKKVAESESEYAAYANTMIAKMYFAGIMPLYGQSFKKCLEHYRKAADVDSYAKSKLDLNTLQGLGCEFDYSNLEKIAAYWADKEYDNNRMDSRLFSDIAAVCISYGQFDKATKIYERIKGDNASVYYQIGLLYKRGVYNLKPGDVPVPNYEMAKYYFKKAADKGKTEATYELGNLFFNPINNEEPDFEKAKKYFKTAADKGNSESQYKLGWIYEYGLDGDGKNYLQAIKYYEMAADNDHCLASLQLAQIYQQPEVCNYKKAFDNAKKSAKGGCDIAKFILGNMYFFGRGTGANIEQAREWYEKAYDDGIYQAKFMLEKIEKMF